MHSDNEKEVMQAAVDNYYYWEEYHRKEMEKNKYLRMEYEKFFVRYS